MTEPYILPSPFTASAAAIFRLFHDEDKAAFLDSSLHNTQGVYSIIGLVPYLTVETAPDGTLINGTYDARPFETVFYSYLRDHYCENPTDLPLTAGAIGYFSYDYACQRRHIMPYHKSAVIGAAASWTFYDFFIIENCRTGAVTFIANGHTCPAAQLMDTMIRRIKQGLTQPPPLSSPPSVPPELLRYSTKEEYLQALQKVHHYILDGHVYVLNLTQALALKSSCCPYIFFTALRRQNPSPFGAYINYGTWQIISASMERLLSLRRGRIETRPIKGTRPRGRTPAEDQKNSTELKNSSKDKSELLMIVDLERNDLHRICQAGTVTVPALYTLETYATVFHLVSTVQGRIRPSVTMEEVIDAVFPGGSVTGAPKQRAMEIIACLEPTPRGLYTGSLGYISLHRDCDLNIVIRTAVHRNGIYHIGVGGGITAESDNDFEYEETWQKAAALQHALQGGTHEPVL